MMTRLPANYVLENEIFLMMEFFCLQFYSSLVDERYLNPVLQAILCMYEHICLLNKLIMFVMNDALV